MPSAVAPRPHPKIRRALRWGCGLFLLAFLAGWALPFAIPLPEALLRPEPASPVFLAADGTPLRQLLSENGQRSGLPTPYADLPGDLIRATLAAEDKRFFSHGGLDLPAIARAAWNNFRHRRVVSGASTLTQQLIKISTNPRRPRTLWTKLVEALQARHLELRWSKEKILTQYLHRVSYGNLFTGCESASSGYLNKPLRDLTVAECAFLASLPQAPGRLNPFTNAAAVKIRQKEVLQRMADNRWLSQEASELASQEELLLQRFTGGFAAPHAVSMLAPGSVSQPVLLTTIDVRLQNRAESIITQRLQLLAGKHVTQAAVVVIENRTGHLLALAGSRDFFGSDGGQINGAWVPHSPGSALKPFTYLLALERGSSPATIIPDLPVEYATPTGLYRPENYDGRFHGPVTLRHALGNSLNIPAVRMLQQIGGAEVLQTALLQLGLTTLDQPAEHYGLGLTIGNAPVRLVELANAYACLARRGEYRPWSLVPQGHAPSTQLYSPAACHLIADILSDNQARLVTFGPHSVIRLPFPCAVKTGTSTSYRDNWAMGFTPEFTVGVWVGNFDNTPMNQVSGVTGAGPILRDMFKHLHETRGTSWYERPPELIQAKIDPRNGLLLSAQSPPVRMSREEIFLRGSLPPPAGTTDYELQTGRAYLPVEYRQWLAQDNCPLTGLATLRPNASADVPPRITTPVNGTVFYLDPDLHEDGRRLLLRSVPEVLHWSSSTLAFERLNNLRYALLTPGTHELVGTHSDTLATTKVRIEVRPPPSAADRRSRSSPPAKPGTPMGQKP